MECIQRFSNPDNAFAFMVQLRWADGVKCPRCGCEGVSFIKTRKIWECKCCKTKKQFSIKTGTIFEESPLPMGTWLCAVWIAVNSKNGVSSHEMARSLGVTQKTAWFMLQRIRLALKAGTFEKMKGTVEVDETYVGGKLRNMHTKRKKKFKGQWYSQKTMVFGMKERGGRVAAKVMEYGTIRTLQGEIRKNVVPASAIYSDQAPTYEGLSKDYAHECVNHDAKVYVLDEVHTNGIENFWSNFKRTLKGSYIHVSKKHLQRYADESCFRFNSRAGKDADRFLLAAGGAQGKRVTYAQLTKAYANGKNC